MTTTRPSLHDLDIDLGKRARLHRILYRHGLRNGTMLALPIDQGLEHGPIDFFPNPPSQDPEFQWRLAVEGGFNAIACHYGLARKYMPKYAGQVPLILKLNGKTNIPPADRALSPLTSTVEDAVRIGADAVGYTLYVGTPRQDDDFAQLRRVRQDSERFGMPLVVWSYPRGEAIDAKGGATSLYAVDYAARTALELGADIAKLVIPPAIGPNAAQPGKYAEIVHTYAEGARRVFRSAGRTMVLVSGGSKLSDEDMLDKVRISMESGATGLIFGRNMWQRPFDEALDIVRQVKEILNRFPS